MAMYRAQVLLVLLKTMLKCCNLKCIFIEHGRLIFLIVSISSPFLLFTVITSVATPEVTNDYRNQSKIFTQDDLNEMDFLNQFKMNVINIETLIVPFILAFSLVYLFKTGVRILLERRHAYCYESFNEMTRFVVNQNVYCKHAIGFGIMPVIYIVFAQERFNWMLFAVCCIVIFIIDHLPITDGDWQRLQKQQRVDRSKALALWCFSYLKNLLSPDGTDTECSFVKRIQIYETQNKVKIRPHKLVLLMPTSCYAPNDFAANDSNIDFADHLPDFQFKAFRLIRNTVWRVKHGKQIIYCVAEIPPALRSFHEPLAQDFSLSITERTELVSNFCLHLKDLLKHSPYPHLLVPYKDRYANGTAVELSTVIWNAIEMNSGDYE